MSTHAQPAARSPSRRAGAIPRVAVVILSLALTGACAGCELVGQPLDEEIPTATLDPVDVVAAPDGTELLASLNADGTLYTSNGVGQHWDDPFQQGRTGSWAAASAAAGSDGRFRLLATGDAGDLLYRVRTGSTWGRFSVEGASGAWSTTVRPAIAAGPRGRVVIAAVQRDGTLYARSEWGGHWREFIQLGPAGSWAGVSVAIGSDGRCHLLAITKAGDLYYRTETRSGWQPFSLQGSPGTWQPTLTPAVAAGPQGRFAIAAVQKDGTLYTRTGRGNRFDRFFRQGRAGSWAAASVAVADNGRTLLLATTKLGDLYSRAERGSVWSDFVLEGGEGSWAPAAAPAIAALPAGEVVSAAVQKDGTLLTSSGRGGPRSDFVPHGNLLSSATPTQGTIATQPPDHDLARRVLTAADSPSYPPVSFPATERDPNIFAQDLGKQMFVTPRTAGYPLSKAHFLGGVIEKLRAPPGDLATSAVFQYRSPRDATSESKRFYTNSLFTCPVTACVHRKPFDVPGVRGALGIERDRTQDSQKEARIFFARGPYVYTLLWRGLSGEAPIGALVSAAQTLSRRLSEPVNGG
jgi:hypothetical protein